MAFRREQDRSSPSLGYRLSSNRQPGIEQANNRMPQYGGPPSRRFPPRQGIEQLPNMYQPIGRPGMGSYQNMDDARREAYAYNTSDRHPTTMSPIMDDARREAYAYNTSDRHPTGRTLFGDEQAAVDPSDWRTLETIMGAGGNPEDYVQSAGIMGAMPEERQMAKVYTNQMPGMIDEGFFWDSLTPEAEAINKVLNMPGIEGMRQGSKSDWNYDDYNKLIPDWLREELPEDAFENLDDFRNQQRITT